METEINTVACPACGHEQDVNEKMGTMAKKDWHRCRACAAVYSSDVQED